MAGNTCVFEESEALQISHISNGGAVHALLPESSLSRCRWLDPSQHCSPFLVLTFANPPALSQTRTRQ
jgi:hypothetical protein